ncbi:MAG: hypothetical protein EXR08_02720 [Alphaproteobacteria bacterium]|nr:hypothetical protein [Alphaproteobacteria bacterium]
MQRPILLSGVIKSAGVVGLVTLLVRVISLGREVAAAAVFGVSADLDVFLIAYLVPSYLFFAVIACAGAAIIPILIRARQSAGEAGLRALIGHANAAGIIGFCGLGLLAALAGSLYLPFLTPHLTPEKAALAQIWLPLLCLLVPLSGLAALWTAIANSQGSLALPACVPVLTPAVTIFMLFTYAKSHGAWAFVNGVLLGAVLECVALGFILRRRGLLIRPRLIRTYDDGLVRGFALLFTGAAIMGLIPAADQAMAATLGTGAITGIIFGGRLVSLIGSAGALALGAAVLPAFASLAAAMDWAGLRRLMRHCLVLTLVLAAPVCLFVSWFSLPLIQIMFQHGQFTSADTHSVAAVQAYYILQIPFYLGWIVLAQVLATLKHNRLLLIFSFAAAVLNVGLNRIMMHTLGAPGIAAATAIVFLLLFAATYAAALFYMPQAAKAREPASSLQTDATGNPAP